MRIIPTVKNYSRKTKKCFSRFSHWVYRLGNLIVGSGFKLFHNVWENNIKLKFFVGYIRFFLAYERKVLHIQFINYFLYYISNMAQPCFSCCFFVSTTPNFEGRIVQPAGLQTSTPIILVFKSGHSKELRCTFAYASNFEGKFRFFYVFTAMLSKLASLNVKECHFLIFKQKSIDFSVLDNVILSKLNNWCKEMRKARPWHLTGLRVYYEIQASNTKYIPF